MAQGEAISVLSRAYLLTENQSYIESAERAIGAFEHSVNEGGVRYIDENDNVFYLEYACQAHPRVLNGFVFSLFGLLDFYKTTGCKKALSLFNHGIKTLKVRLKDYDTSDWTYYDLLGKRSTKTYHRIHYTQLFELYSLTRDWQFLEYAEKWSSYIQK